MRREGHPDSSRKQGAITNVNGIFTASIWRALSLCVLLVTGAFSQTAGAESKEPQSATPVAADDMRLWSFGDCNRRFPSPESDSYKECVRIVGSEEAKDARAYHFCATSHDRDRAEAERCRQAYEENKKAAKSALQSAPSTGAQAPLSPEMMQRVKSIASIGVETNPAAQAEAGQSQAAPPAPVPEVSTMPAQPKAPPDVSSASKSLLALIGFLVLVVAGLSIRAAIVRRKNAGGQQY